MTRTALLQLTSSDDPSENLETITKMAATAIDRGATFVLTPEVSNCLSTSRTHQAATLVDEQSDTLLAALQALCAKHSVTILAGSLALKPDGFEERFCNRSILIGTDGRVQARYDKIHMFDVAVSETETYRESANYLPGKQAILADAAPAKLGMTICYDLRFPHLFRVLAKAGAQVISVPSAFSPVTGAAHWHVLLRARAIETGCFILAPAQTGQHRIRHGRPRATYGHSLVVSPWGEVLADAGTEPGIAMVDLDLSLVDDARNRIPSLNHDRDF